MHDDALADDEYCPDGHGDPNGDDMPTPQYLCTAHNTTASYFHTFSSQRKALRIDSEVLNITPSTDAQRRDTNQPGAALHPGLQLPDPVDDANVPMGHGEQYWDPATLY